MSKKTKITRESVHESKISRSLEKGLGKKMDALLMDMKSGLIVDVKKNRKSNRVLKRR